MKRKEIQELIEAMSIEKQLHLWNMYCEATEQYQSKIYGTYFSSISQVFNSVQEFFTVAREHDEDDLFNFFAYDRLTGQFASFSEDCIEIDTHAISELIKDEMFTLEPQKYKEEKNLTDFELFDEVLQRLI